METEPTNISCAAEKCVSPPTACLSDVDDISDIDVEDAVDKMHKTITSKPAYDLKRSVFNTTLDLAEVGSECELAGAGIEAYVERVAREKQTWEGFATRYMDGAGAGRASPATYRPSAEQQAHLDAAPNLHGFIRGAAGFMSDASRFLAQFEQMQELQQDLKECCQFRAHRAQRNRLAECLARIA